MSLRAWLHGKYHAPAWQNVDRIDVRSGISWRLRHYGALLGWRLLFRRVCAGMSRPDPVWSPARGSQSRWMGEHAS